MPRHAFVDGMVDFEVLALQVGAARELAEARGITDRAIYGHLNQIYQKQSISGQVDLVRLVLSIAEFR